MQGIVRWSFALSALLTAGLVGLSGDVAASVLHVPGDAPTIQQAIALAGHGDTILVAPGTYVETIDFLGKRLVVQGEGGAAVTTIDGAGAGTVVTAAGGEPKKTALRGFTVTGGAVGRLVEYTSQFGTSLGMGGGGVFVGADAQLQVEDCVIAGNALANTGLQTFGGGVMVDKATARLLGCTISNNASEYGAGVSTFYGGAKEILLRSCTISGNATEGSSAAAIQPYGSRLTASDCLVSGNAGTGLATSNTFTLRLRGCTFKDNTGWGYTGFHSIDTWVFGCSFLGNGLGGAKLNAGPFFETFTTVHDCVFAAGDALESHVNGAGEHLVTNCTFDGANIVANAGDVVVRDCIVRNVTGAFVQGSYDTLTVTYSDVEGGFPGTGNIDAAPLWVNPAAGDYHLFAGSPCIDAGDPASPVDANLSITDMGAFPYAGWDDLGGGTFANAVPELRGQGLLLGGETVALQLAGALPATPTVLIFGIDALAVPFKDGFLWPTLDLVLPGLVTDGAGDLTLIATWPAGLPSGLSFLAQFWYPNPAWPSGYAGSNAVMSTVP
jgi:hypothetical protein